MAYLIHPGASIALDDVVFEDDGDSVELRDSDDISLNVTALVGLIMLACIKAGNGQQLVIDCVDNKCRNIAINNMIVVGGFVMNFTQKIW